MIMASKLAGKLAAHAIWSLSDEGMLTPMFGFTDEHGKLTMERFIAESFEDSVLQGREKLSENPMDATDAVLIYDGRITVGGEKIDAVIIELRAYFSPTSQAAFAVPYRPATPGPFRVHRPQLLEWKNCEDFDTDHALESFFDGVDSHSEGSKVWKAALDASM